MIESRPGKIGRRTFLKVAGISGAALVVPGCDSGSSRAGEPAVVTPREAQLPSTPEAAKFTGSLSTHMSPEIIALFELEKLKGIPLETYKLNTADGIPTFVYNQDKSISIDTLAMQQAIDAFTGQRFSILISSLKVGKTPNVDYFEDTPFPDSTTFRYDYSINRQDQPIGVVPYSPAETVRERHFVIVNGGDVPQWAKNIDVGTLRRKLSETSLAIVTLLDIDKLSKRDGEKGDNFNHVMHVEISQQTVYTFALDSGVLVTNLDAIPFRIAKEGLCNIVGTAANEKRKGSSWKTVAEIDKGVLFGMAGLPAVKQFQITEAFYDALPSGDPLLTVKR